MGNDRVALLLFHYPKLSETYIRCEVRELRRRMEVGVFAQHQATDAFADPGGYRVSTKTRQIAAWVREFKPRILHGHWLNTLEWIHEISESTGIPYTLRSHSFDVLQPSVEELAKLAPRVRDPLCLGILGFPYAREKLTAAGFPGEKLVDVFPVANLPIFRNRGPNGDRIMNVGACLPKKKMEDYLRLAKLVPGRGFDLYPIGYNQEAMKLKAAEMGSPVEFIPALEPDRMPAEYKRHQWLVYTGDFDMKTVGWPVSVAEAQASGVGVCIANLRPDLKELVGDAGYLYDSIEEVVDIVSKPFDPERRDLGFKLAERADFAGRVHELTDLWSRAVPRPPARSAGSFLSRLNPFR